MARVTTENAEVLRDLIAAEFLTWLAKHCGEQPRIPHADRLALSGAISKPH